MRSLRHQWFIGWLLLTLIGGPCPCLGGGSARAESAPASSTEFEALQAELERIKTTLVRIQRELTLIRQLLSPRAAQPAALIVKLRVMLPLSVTVSLSHGL
jgi:hypothetical protein